MQQNQPKETHPHEHGPGCGHLGIRHDGHVDYVHDGRLHRQRQDGAVEEHVVPVDEQHPAECRPLHGSGEHEAGHRHGPGCGHEAVPHGDHIDYLVEGRLHHPHGDHCDDHGVVEVVQRSMV